MRIRTQVSLKVFIQRRGSLIHVVFIDPFKATKQQLSGATEGDPRMHLAGDPEDHKVPRAAGEDSEIHARSVRSKGRLVGRLLTERSLF